jgi:hypothetical protein
MERKMTEEIAALAAYAAYADAYVAADYAYAALDVAFAAADVLASLDASRAEMASPSF